MPTPAGEQLVVIASARVARTRPNSSSTATAAPGCTTGGTARGLAAPALCAACSVMAAATSSHSPSLSAGNCRDPEASTMDNPARSRVSPELVKSVRGRACVIPICVLQIDPEGAVGYYIFRPGPTGKTPWGLPGRFRNGSPLRQPAPALSPRPATGARSPGTRCHARARTPDRRGCGHRRSRAA
ncbi:MAG: hypothetical protein AW07_03084 [Candidatus Accumulibacter sp. SK-11]|nr:MAG: hypothetical protein AW07_03084 [Candidatus Accumulibacter sp. SK-11]